MSDGGAIQRDSTGQGEPLPFGASVAALNTSLYHPWSLFTGSPKQQARCLCSLRGTDTLLLPPGGASPDTRVLSSGSAGDQGLPAPRPGRHRAARGRLHHVHPARGPGHAHHTPPQARRHSPCGLRAGCPGTDTGRSVPAPHPKMGTLAAARNPDSRRTQPAVFLPIRKVRR